tara:strand:- start:2814 stop:3014 length:201 start_codon:yes stop_codon:yes gene_type:complete
MRAIKINGENMMVTDESYRSMQSFFMKTFPDKFNIHAAKGKIKASLKFTFIGDIEFDLKETIKYKQ